jgi:hydroxymethylpyrimidine/phosphomethylpyrimidine kinase
MLVLTPNLPELRWLTGEEDVERAARMLIARGVGGVVVKGGHARVRSGMVVDLVVTSGGVRALEVPAQKRKPEKRGTGCRHASALAAGLAKGHSLVRAARGAQRHVAQYLRDP